MVEAAERQGFDSNSTIQPINVKTHLRHLRCKIHERPLFGESLIEPVQARSMHDKIIFRAACSVPTCVGNTHI